LPEPDAVLISLGIDRDNKVSRERSRKIGCLEHVTTADIGMLRVALRTLLLRCARDSCSCSPAESGRSSSTPTKDRPRAKVGRMLDSLTNLTREEMRLTSYPESASAIDVCDASK